jgi:hypothetical protein
LILSRNLPPPLRPSAPGVSSAGEDPDPWERRGSLSDFSDYESSDEETHARAGRSYLSESDDPGDHDIGNGKGHSGAEGKPMEDDPFADPFA